MIRRRGKEAEETKTEMRRPKRLTRRRMKRRKINAARGEGDERGGSKEKVKDEHEERSVDEKEERWKETREKERRR